MGCYMVACAYQDFLKGAALRGSDINCDLVCLDLKENLICLHTLTWLLENASNGSLCTHISHVLASRAASVIKMES